MPELPFDPDEPPAFGQVWMYGEVPIAFVLVRRILPEGLWQVLWLGLHPSVGPTMTGLSPDPAKRLEKYRRLA